MNHKRWIKQAKEQAENSSLCAWQLGAVIVKGKTVIGKGFNRFSAKSEQMEQQYGLTNLFSLHAEMDAILDVQGDMNGATMFIAGVKTNGNRVYCRPCDDCMKILRHTNLKAVYYETKHGVEAIIFE